MANARWSFGVSSCLMLAAAGVLPAARGADVVPEKIRVVACDAQVQSHKRGVCANHLSKEDFLAFAPGVSWWYTWGTLPTDLPPEGTAMEFLPMVWGDRPNEVKALDGYLAAGHKPRAVLALNEPNLKDQAFITPEVAAKAYKAVKGVADKYKEMVVGPHMSLGSPANGSITAMDPIEKKQVTYTFMVPYLKAFNYFMGDVEVPATAFHAYGDIYEMRWATETMIKEFHKPVWVTEYAFWKAANPKDAQKYLIQSTDFLERNPEVAGYAWFKERANDNRNISLLEKESGKLSALGEIYVKMPVHDADVYYKLPGKLQAENYVTLDKAEVFPTTDKEGFLQMQAEGADATLDYHVQVEAAGKYEVTFRTQKAGKIDLMAGGNVLATVESTGKEWESLKATVELPAGPQTLRVRFDSKGEELNWVDVEKK